MKGSFWFPGLSRLSRLSRSRDTPLARLCFPEPDSGSPCRNRTDKQDGRAVAVRMDRTMNSDEYNVPLAALRDPSPRYFIDNIHATRRPNLFLPAPLINGILLRLRHLRLRSFFHLRWYTNSNLPIVTDRGEKMSPSLLIIQVKLTVTGYRPPTGSGCLYRRRECSLNV